MSNQDWLMLIGGGFLGHFLFHVVGRLFRATLVEVEDEHVVLLTRFGKLHEVLSRPGAHVRPSRMLPWVKEHEVSLARDFRLFSNVHVNDARGTTVLVDLWVELRIVDPRKALFAVEDWERSLTSLVTHAATSILGARDFQQILHDRSELGEVLEREVNAEAQRWGVLVERTFIRNVALLPEVSRQLFGAIAARLERAKALVEEGGRVEVARLEADTRKEIAGLVAEAKAQYPLHVGRALKALARTPPVLAAYQSLYALSQVRPVRTVAFRGFADGELSAVDSAMIPAPGEAPVHRQED